MLGGGPAGCEAALVLAERGHTPVLCEAGSTLGGNLIPGGTPDFKEDDRALAKWFSHELAERGVEVRLNTRMSAEDILAEKFDALVLATGSRPKTLPLEGGHVLTAEDVLLGKADPGKKTVIVGGGLVGCETALWLKKKGVEVTIVEALPKLLAVNGPLCHANSEMLEALIPFSGIETVCGASLSGVDADGASVTKDGETTHIDADSVILCIGYRSENSLYEPLQDKVAEIYQIGDANRVANIMYAIWDAFEVANHI